MTAGRAAVIQLKLQGQRAMQAGLGATAASIKGLQGAVAEYNATAEVSTRRSWLWNQALFTLRRYAYAGTLAITGLGTAAAIMGFKFNASMESNRMAFTQFLGSAQLANKELTYLYNLAKYTPFEFSNVTSAARRFLAFGYSLRETNKYLQIIGDTAAAFGGSGDLIERMVLVFGQIRASGRLLGQDMLQLEQQGVPVLEILQKQLGLTAEQLGRIGAVGIPAYVGIPALMRGMHELFAGMALKQAQTFSGQLSTLHDNLSQVFGALTLRQFNKASKGLLPGLNKMFDDMTKLIQKQKGRITLAQALGIAEAHYPWIKPIADITQRLLTLGRAFWNFFMKVLWPAIRIALIPVLILLVQLMWGLTKVLNILAAIPGLKYLVAVFLIILMTEFAWVRLIALLTRVTWLIRFLRMGKLAKTLMTEEQLKNIGKLDKYLMRLGDRWKWFWRTTVGGGALRSSQRLWQILRTGQVAMPSGRFPKYTAFEKFIQGMRLKALAGAKSIGRAFEVLRTGSVQGPGGFQKLTPFEKWIRRMRIVAIGQFLKIGAGFKYLKNAGEALFKGRVTGKFLQQYNRLERVLIRLRIFILRLIPAIRGVGIALWTFVSTNPIIAIIGAVILLIVALVVLYYKWGWFHKHVDKTWHWIKDHWRLLAIVIFGPFMPMIPLFILILDNIKRIINWAKTLIGWLKSAWGWMQKINPVHWIGVGAHAIGGFFSGGGGGQNTQPGAERRGPMLSPRGASYAAAFAGAHQTVPQLNVTVHSELHVDRKKLAESVFKAKTDKAARK